MFIKKYRTKNFDEIIGFPENIKGLINDDMPHLFFSGKPGTGKSLISEAIEHFLGWETLKLNVSDKNGVEVVRTTVKKFMTSKSFNDKPKLLRFEEFDRLSVEGQKILRDWLETYANNCKVIFTLNYPTKIIDAIKDRCVQINLDSKNKHDIKKHLVSICENEIIVFEEEAIDRIIKMFYPSIRSMVNKLEELSLVGVTLPNIHLVDNKISELANFLLDKNYTEACMWCVNSDSEPTFILDNLFYYFTENSVLDKGKEVKVIKAIGETEFRLGLSENKIIQLNAGLIRIIEALI